LRKITLFLLVACFIASAVYAQDMPKDKARGASEKAYEHASDQSVFHRVSDWFATVGKSKEEKTKILAERKAIRAKQKAEAKIKKMTEKKVAAPTTKAIKTPTPAVSKKVESAEPMVSKKVESAQPTLSKETEEAAQAAQPVKKSRSKYKR